MYKHLKLSIKLAKNIEKVEITKTELRALMFWATVGVRKSNGGSYYSVVDFIKKNYAIMPFSKKKYKNLFFCSETK